MSFEQLCEELETLTKSYGDPDGDGKGEGDEKIQAAADGGDGGSAEDDEEGDGSDGGNGGEPMAKSFSFTLEDGTVIEAQDGTELVKSLMGRVDARDQQFLKAFESLTTVVKAQDQLIKSLQGDIKKFSGEGRGRKAVVTPVSKPAAGAPAVPAKEGMTGQEFMTKCMDALGAGRITSVDVSRAESALNRGVPVPQDIVARVTK